MEPKRKINQKLSWVFTILAIGELAGALAIVAYGLLKGHMSGLTCNVIMGAALGIYWLLSDVAEPFAVHRFDGISQAQKEAYVKYILLDLVGFAGIACFLFGVGGSSSGGSTGILGAVVYVVVMKPKRENQQIFYGHIDPEATDTDMSEEAEEATPELPEDSESKADTELTDRSISEEEK